MDVIVDRCAGLDVHKKTVMTTVRSPEEALAAAVQSARAERHIWSRIGAILGTSGEATRQRYG